MVRKPRVLLLNRTCGDVFNAHLNWLQSQDIEILVRPELFSLTLEELPPELSIIDGVIGPAADRITASQLRRFPNLRVISLASSGYDSVDLAAASAANIQVTNALVEAGAEVVADLTWGLILAVSRQIPLHDRQIRAGNYARGMGSSPWRKTLGIVGLGQIGRAVARRAAGFDMSIIAVEPSPDIDFVSKYQIRLVGLEQLLAESDYVTLHVRLDDETHGMINADRLNRMKSTAYLINAARREIVDESALAEALERSELAGAALDDPPSDKHNKMLSMSNVVFTTHIGNRAIEGVNAVFRRAIINAADVLADRPCPFTVNTVPSSRVMPPTAFLR